MDTLAVAHQRFVRRAPSLALSLALAVAALLLLRALAEAAAPRSTPRAPAVTFTVNTTIDTPDNDTGDHLCHISPAGPCSLRAAVQQLDHDSGGAINLPAGTYILTSTAGDLQLQKNITLNGAGPSATIIQGNPISWTHRILRIQNGANAIVSGVTISGGHPLGAVGGGIDVVTGTLLLTGSVVLSNTADTGGGIYNSGQLSIQNSIIRGNQSTFDGGGGVYNDASNLAISPGAQLTVSLSSIVSNTAAYQGGGLYDNDPSSRGLVQLTNSSLSGNQALNGDGGGIYQSGGTIILVASVLQLNTALNNGGALADIVGVANVLISRIETNTAKVGNGGGIIMGSGSLYVIGSTVAGNRSHGDGGGIASCCGTLSLLGGGILSNTSADVGGGLFVSGGSGTINDVALRFNQAAAGGAGLYNAGGALNLTNNTLIDNNTTITITAASGASRPSTLGPGAGMYNEAGGTISAQNLQLLGNTGLGTGGGAINYGLMRIFSSTVSRNSAANGGGLYNAVTGTLVISASTLSDNAALSAAGGGLSNDGAGAETFMVNSTVDGNRSATNGGGLANEQGVLYLSSVTVADNQADSDGSGTGDGGGMYNASIGTLFLRDSVVALNTDRGRQAPDCAGNLNSEDYNLVQSIAGCTLYNLTTGNLTGRDPKLWPLGNYGGPTETRAPMLGSPVLDAGNPAGCQDNVPIVLKIDQRGFPRPAGPRCDIGAVEGALTLPLRVLLPLIER